MGNSLKGSRPILSFDAAFNGEPYLRLLRELLTHTFGVPPTARKAKPFIDRVVVFIVADGRIWVRHYQIAEEEVDASKNEKLSLREIGPRFCLTPIYIQEGSLAVRSSMKISSSFHPTRSGQISGDAIQGASCGAFCRER
ncbi:brix domain-containing protein 2, partial [Metarhizium hybridum]